MCWRFFLITLEAFSPVNLLKKTPTQVFSCDYYEIFKDSFFYRTPVVTALVLWTITMLNSSRALKNLRSVNDFSFTNFISNRVMVCSAKSASYCCFRKAVSNYVFQKFLLSSASAFYFCSLSADRRLWKVCSTKGAGHYCFCSTI